MFDIVKHEPGRGLNFDYEPNAHCPTWEWFLLKELFPDDEEASQMIEEQLGYGMTIDNQFEKAALWIGPPRSGRGTIAHIQELLVGVNGYTSLNIHTWHKTENSRQGMIGKRVGIFHDVRLKRAQQYGNVSYDPPYSTRPPMMRPEGKHAGGPHGPLSPLQWRPWPGLRGGL